MINLSKGFTCLTSLGHRLPISRRRSWMKHGAIRLESENSHCLNTCRHGTRGAALWEAGLTCSFILKCSKPRRSEENFKHAWAMAFRKVQEKCAFHVGLSITLKGDCEWKNTLTARLNMFELQVGCNWQVHGLDSCFRNTIMAMLWSALDLSGVLVGWREKVLL